MKKKLVATIAVVSMLAVALVGATLAFFTDTADEVVNTFTMANDPVKITLDESDVSYDDQTHTWTKNKEKRVPGNDYEKIYPGAVLPKDPMVTNKGDYDAFVRLDVTVDNFDTFQKIIKRHVDKGDFDDEAAAMAAIFPDYDEKKWDRFDKEVPKDKKTATYKYIWSGEEGAAIVAPSGSTDPIFEKVVIPGCFDQDDMEALDGGFKITAFAYAIQADGAEKEVLVKELKEMAKPE